MLLVELIAGFASVMITIWVLITLQEIVTLLKLQARQNALLIAFVERIGDPSPDGEVERRYIQYRMMNSNSIFPPK